MPEPTPPTPPNARDLLLVMPPTTHHSDLEQSGVVTYIAQHLNCPKITAAVIFDRFRRAHGGPIFFNKATRTYQGMNWVPTAKADEGGTQKNDCQTRARATSGTEESLQKKDKKAKTSKPEQEVAGWHPGKNVSAQVIERLAERFTPDEICRRIEDLLDATHLSGGGKQIPDNRAREGGLKLLLSYLVGLPVQRQEIVTVNFDSLESLKERAKASPSLRASLAKVQAQAQAPVDVQIDGEQPGPDAEPKQS
jgi:hypothetical protein